DDNNVDIQELIIIPVEPESFSEALQMGTETFHQLKAVLQEKALNTTVGDEGGSAPDLKSNQEALDTIVHALEQAGYEPRNDMVSWYEEMVEKEPIISIEDGLDENDWEGHKLLTDRLGDHVQLVGDDLFVTNTEKLFRGIEEGISNSILIKVNQIGTLTETFE